MKQLTRKLPRPGIGYEVFSSYSSLNSFSCRSLRISAISARTVSGVTICWLIGMVTPLILMLIGAPTEMKMSEAFFSAISSSSRFIAMVLPPRELACRQSPRSSSLMPVLARVFASTRLTITAQ